MEQVLSRFYKDQRTIILPGAYTPTITWSPQLVFSPGYFSYNGLVYDLTQSGLYRFWNPMVNTTHMVIGAGDPVGLLTGAAWLSSFGDEDAKLGSETQAQFLTRVGAKARTSKLKLLCEHTIDFSRTHLLSGEMTRKVRFLTMETPNNVVDGHVCVEVRIGGVWVLADVSLDTMFKDSSGTRLSARGVVAPLADNSFQYEPLASDSYAVETASSYTFDATGYAETFLLTEEDRRSWHRRIFQAVGIDHTDGLTYFALPAGSESRASWVLGLSSAYRVISLATFNGMFY